MICSRQRSFILSVTIGSVSGGGGGGGGGGGDGGRRRGGAQIGRCEVTAERWKKLEGGGEVAAARLDFPGDCMNIIGRRGAGGLMFLFKRKAVPKLY